jgi:hypothetical protein
MALEFGIFDHVDRHDQPLKDFYEDRLKLIEAYDRAGIYGYHCAEHHSTPLGMAPSPSVYLAAVGQRTKRLASARWSIRWRSTIRCGSPKKSACSTR